MVESKWIYTLFAVLMTAITLILFVYYNKLGCLWGPIPVILIGLLVAVVLVAIFQKFEWFSGLMDAPMRFAIVLLVGMILTAFLGIYFTEPIRDGKTENQIQKERVVYNYSDSRVGYWYFYNSGFYSGGGSSTVSTNNSSSSSSSSSSDVDGEALAFLAIIVVVIIAVVGSALIPHFWVMMLMVLIALMAQIAYREWGLEDRRKRRNW